MPWPKLTLLSVWNSDQSLSLEVPDGRWFNFSVSDLSSSRENGSIWGGARDLARATVIENRGSFWWLLPRSPKKDGIFRFLALWRVISERLQHHPVRSRFHWLGPFWELPPCEVQVPLGPFWELPVWVMECCAYLELNSYSLLAWPNPSDLWHSGKQQIVKPWSLPGRPSQSLPPHDRGFVAPVDNITHTTSRTSMTILRWEVQI